MSTSRFARIPYRIYTMALAVACIIGVLLFGLGFSFYWHEKQEMVDRALLTLNQSNELAGLETNLILYQLASRYEETTNQTNDVLSSPYREQALAYNNQLQQTLETLPGDAERDVLDAFATAFPTLLTNNQTDEVPYDLIESTNRRWMYQGLELTNEPNAVYEAIDSLIRMQTSFMRQNMNGSDTEVAYATLVSSVADEATLLRQLVDTYPEELASMRNVMESGAAYRDTVNAAAEARYVASVGVYEDIANAIQTVRTDTATQLRDQQTRYGSYAWLTFLATVLSSVLLLVLLIYTRRRYGNDLGHLKARALAIDPSYDAVASSFPNSHDFRAIEDDLKEIATSVHSTVHELETQSADLLRYHERWSSLFSETGLAIALMDDAYELIERNEVFRQFFGERNIFEINQLFTTTGRRLFEDALEGVNLQGTSAQFILHLKGEHTTFLNMKITPLKRDEQLTYYLIVEDETERVERERKVDRLVRFDLATGLYNEYGFLRAWDKQEIAGSFALIRLHDYHHVVDWYDPAYADQLMKEFARFVETRLAKYANHLFGRYRDDTFMLYVKGLSHEDEDEWLELFPTELFLNQKRQNVHVQIGATVTEVSYQDCLFQATKALQHAKESRTPFVWYDATILAQMQWYALIEQALPEAIRKGDITVAYQPQVELKTGRVIGAEVLARWQHAELGAIPPNEFIRIAERSDQILWLSHSVLDQTIRQLVAWRDTPMGSISLSYNLSAHSVDPSIVHKLRDSIETYPWLPDRLKIELTESADIMSHASELERLEEIAHLGYCLSIDDFGTGYASFEAIWHLPIQELKIDRMYVSGKAKDSTSFLRAVSRFASEQQLMALAEGIETVDDLERMIQEGVELGQGYYFAPALASKTFEAWVIQRTGHSI